MSNWSFHRFDGQNITESEKKEHVILKKMKFLQPKCNSVEHIRIPNNWQEYDVLEHFTLAKYSDISPRFKGKNFEVFRN